MSVQLTADQDFELAELARVSERTTDEVAQEAVARFLAAQAEHGAAVQVARTQVARGETIPHEEVFARLKQSLGW